MPSGISLVHIWLPYVIFMLQAKKILIFLGLNLCGTLTLLLWCHDTNSMGKLCLFEPQNSKMTSAPSVRAVWSESSLSAWRNFGFLATHWAHSEDSDQTTWIWVIAGHIFCWFCHAVALVLTLIGPLLLDVCGWCISWCLAADVVWLEAIDTCQYSIWNCLGQIFKSASDVCKA